MYVNNSLEEYLKDLAARSITPGGGSASALTAAIGASLNLMVINYSIEQGKETYEGLVSAKQRQQESLDHLSSLVDEDCRVFRELVEALSSKRDAEKEYIAAATVPMNICREAHISMDITSYLVDNANRKLISDVGCAAHILKSAFYAAQLNVQINLRWIKDVNFIESAENALRTMRKDIEKVDADIIQQVRNIINAGVAYG
jgi:formiminotetrahydrofolate cyclodeaminase